MWGEVGSSFARNWRGFFTRLERLHQLKRDNPYHIWLLHHLFLPTVNADCQEFQRVWNHKPISGDMSNGSPHVGGPSHYLSRTNSQPPQDKRLMGMAQHGVYDETEGVDPATLHQFYGVTSPVPVASDAEPVLATIRRNVGAGQKSHVRHEAVDPPTKRCPFKSDEELSKFLNQFDRARSAAFKPNGFNLEKRYEVLETYRTGRKRKEITASLTHNIWYPRVLCWCQGLQVMIELTLDL
jgi:hypothetical protein